MIGYILLTLILATSAFAHSFQGAGTETSPYLIETTNGLDSLAADVNAGNSFSGKYFRLENDLDYSTVTLDENGNNYTPIGIYSPKYNGFAGTFDGNNKTISGIIVTKSNSVGLFGFTQSESSVKNLTITNSTFNGNIFAGAVVGNNRGTVENIYVSYSTTVGTDNTPGPDSHGGVVGTNEGTVNATVSRALVDCPTNQLSCFNFGGIVGNNSGGIVTNNLYLETPFSETTRVKGTSRVGWIVGQTSGNTSSNFYTRTLGAGGIGILNSPTGADVAGKAEAQHTIEEPLYGARLQKGSPTATHSNGIKVYDWGLVYNENNDETYFFNSTSTIQLYYYGNECVVTGYTCNGTGCSISGSTLTVGTGDENGVTHIDSYTSGTGTSSDPYQIPDETAWNFFAKTVAGSGYCDFEGEFFKLTHNISVSTSVGGNIERDFKGTFDGDNHTITVSYGSSDSPSDNSSLIAPFTSVKNGTIKNLHTAGTIYANVDWAAGIVSRTSGTTTLENCHSSVTIHSSITVGKNGGLIGTVYTGTTTIKDSYFDGKLLGNTSTKNGGLIGWVNAAANLDGVLFKPSQITMSETDSKTLYIANDYSAVNCSGCYYTQAFGEAQGIQLHTSVSTEAGVWSKSITAPDNETYYQHGNVNITTEAQYNVEMIPITPSPTSIQFEETDLELNTDYTVMYIAEGSDVETSFIFQAGNYTMVIHGNGNYTGTATVNITVTGIENSEESPYLITSTDDWNIFALAVNSGNTFEGKFLELAADINVSEMVGNDNNRSFMGTFNGNEHTINVNYGNSFSGDNSLDLEYRAPFRFINGATIKNLHTAGTIYTRNKYAAGIAGSAKGNSVLDNCHSSITINSYMQYSGAGVISGDDGTDGSIGGLIGAISDGTTNISNSYFDGEMLGQYGLTTSYSGGFIGSVDNNATATITNGLFRPSNLEMGLTQSGTFYRLNSNVTLENCYYTQSYGERQGAQVTITLPESDLSQKTGVLPDRNEYYIAQGATVTVDDFYNYNTLAGAVVPMVKVGNQELENGSDYTYEILKGETPVSDDYAMDGGLYTVTVTGAGAYSGTISTTFRVLPKLEGEGTENDPYRISDELDWESLVQQVASGNTFSGYFFKLENNISVTTMVGTSTYNFSGTFDGNGDSITIAYGSSGSYFAEPYVAPFRYVDAATIKNLYTTGSIFTSKKFAAGIASHVTGNTVIRNCHSNVTITSSVSGDGTHGGLVAHIEGGTTYTVTIADSHFDGSILGTSTNSSGGIVGWSTAKVNFENCLFNPQNITVGTSNSATFARGTSSNYTFTNSFYTRAFGTAQGQFATTSPTDGMVYKKTLTTAVDGKGYHLVASFSGFQDTYFLSDDLDIYPTLTVNGTTLTKGVDFDVTYNVPYNGNHPITIEGIGDYEGSYSKNVNFIGKFKGEGTEGDPYIIANTLDWKSIVQMVARGNTLEGKFLKMTANISVTEMIGSDTTAHYFAGTFDGDGKTLTIQIGNVNNNLEENNVGPFRYIDGATIKRLRVNGEVWVYTIYDYKGIHASALVGYAKGNSLITNNRVSTRIVASGFNSSFVGGQHGGLVGAVGANASLTIKDCLFDGELLKRGDGYINHNAGFIGKVPDNARQVTIENCLFNPQNVTLGSAYSSIFARGPATIINSYYTSTVFGTDQGGNDQGIDGRDMDAYDLVNLLGYAWWEGYERGVAKALPSFKRYETRYGAITVFEDNSNGNKTAKIDGDFREKEEAIIDHDIQVNSVTFNRTFNVPSDNTPVYSTIMLPFSIKAGEVGGATFYQLSGFEKNAEGKWKTAVVTPINDTTDLEANTPYLLAASNSTISFTNQSPLTLNTTRGTKSVTFGNWEFRGTYSYIEYADTPDLIGRAYGFAGQELDGFKIGEFVKLGYGAKTAAMRAYLVYNEGNSSPKSAAGLSMAPFDLPETMDVVIVDSEGKSIGGGTMNTVTGEIRMDRWFDLQGRKLNSKPTTKGTYYLNGKRVIIK